MFLVILNSLNFIRSLGGGGGGVPFSPEGQFL